MLASSSDAPLFNLAAMDADLALANAQPQQRHSNSGSSSSSCTRIRSKRTPYLRGTSDLTGSSSVAAGKRPSVSSVLLSQLASSLDHELHDPDDAFDVPSSNAHVGLLGTSSPSCGITKSSTASAAALATAGPVPAAGRRSRARGSVHIVPPPPSSKVGGAGGPPGPLRREAYRRARSCPLETHAELPSRHTLRDMNYESVRCLQVSPSADLLNHDRTKTYVGSTSGKRRSYGPDQESNVGAAVPLASQIASSITLTDAELSERTAALNYILTNPAHFRQLQADLRSSSVVTTHCSSVVVDQLLSERIARMRQVREKALRKMREERDRDREYARQVGILPFDDGSCGEGNANTGATTCAYNDCDGGTKNAKTTKAGWDHLLAGLSSVANLGAGFLNKQSSTLSEDQHRYRHHHRDFQHHVHDDDGMDWNIDQPTASTTTSSTAPKRPSSIALQDIKAIAPSQEQDKKTSLSTVAETLSRSSSGDFSMGEEQDQAATRRGGQRRALAARGA